MSHYDYEFSKHLGKDDPPFAALIMAAYRKADTQNSLLLLRAFPDIIRELQNRYDAPAGLLDGEQVAKVCTVSGCGEPAPGMLQLCEIHAGQYDETGRVPA